MKLLIETGETDSTGVRLIVDGIDLGAKPDFAVLDADRKPIARCIVTKENGRLYAELDALPDRYLDHTPAIGISVKLQDQEETTSGRIDVIRCYLRAVFLSTGPNKDPRIKSVREQMET